MNDINCPKPNFNTSFQRGLIKIALNEDFFASQVVRYLSLDTDVEQYKVFNTKELCIIFDCLTKSMAKYRTRPSEAQIRQYITEFAESEQVTLNQTLDDILAEDIHDLEFYREQLTNFVQQAKMGVGFGQIRESWRSDKLATIDVMQALIDSIRQVQFEEEDILTLHDIDDITNDAKDMLENLIPTGLKALDKDLLGGLPRENFVAVLGGTNSGKSLFCISLGSNAMRLGKKVLHISLEGMRNEALMRYTSNLSGVPIRGMMQSNLTPQQKVQLNSAREYEENLRIHNMLSFGVTIEDLASKCREIYKDFQFDMFIVDYSQLLESKQKTEGSRQTQTYVHRALAAMAREFNCVVVSPIQATRGAQKEQQGFKSKKSGENDPAPILRTDDISEDINIARVAGVILTLNRTDAEAKDGKLRVFLEKQRLEEKNKIYGVMTEYGLCRLITDRTYDPNAVADSVDMFEDSNDKMSTSMTAMIAKKEMDDRDSLRRKINKLHGDIMNINGTIKTALSTFKAQVSPSDADKEGLQAFLEAEKTRKAAIEAEIIPAVALYYPKATEEAYRMAIESIKDMEKSGEDNPMKLRDQKEIVKHWAYLYDKGKPKS
jgi:KaiC/GvpD/RAD55 family RecA-like ATPase